MSEGVGRLPQLFPLSTETPWPKRLPILRSRVHPSKRSGSTRHYSFHPAWCDKRILCLQNLAALNCPSTRIQDRGWGTCQVLLAKGSVNEKDQLSRQVLDMLSRLKQPVAVVAVVGLTLVVRFGRLTCLLRALPDL